MKLFELMKISAIIALWALIIAVMLPKACDKEAANQNAKNAGYSQEFLPKQYIGDYYGQR